MCKQWKAESWVKRRKTAAVNRASGAPEGNKAPSMYKGGSISQLQHVVARPMPHTAADCVRAICRDRNLLRTLRVHLQSLDPDELVDAVATAAQQETDDKRRHRSLLSVADNSVADVDRRSPPSDQIICDQYQRLYSVAITYQRPLRSQIGYFVVVTPAKVYLALT
ncbi:hypothetical protein MRB53_016666 [Persea americana]|uniref:Uncharacterized protein n=1 Tax=Persea americana TaxID=3435 RepID=A0ACC2M2I9_PERAE|nr:hypothetical protein MRB53_016666 [Persea americana]